MAKRRLRANLSPAAVSGRRMGAVAPGSSTDRPVGLGGNGVGGRAASGYNAQDYGFPLSPSAGSKGIHCQLTGGTESYRAIRAASGARLPGFALPGPTDRFMHGQCGRFSDERIR